MRPLVIAQTTINDEARVTQVQPKGATEGSTEAGCWTYVLRDAEVIDRCLEPEGDGA